MSEQQPIHQVNQGDHNIQLGQVIDSTVHIWQVLPSSDSSSRAQREHQLALQATALASVWGSLATSHVPALSLSMAALSIVCAIAALRQH